MNYSDWEVRNGRVYIKLNNYMDVLPILQQTPETLPSTLAELLALKHNPNVHTVDGLGWFGYEMRLLRPPVELSPNYVESIVVQHYLSKEILAFTQKYVRFSMSLHSLKDVQFRTLKAWSQEYNSTYLTDANLTTMGRNIKSSVETRDDYSIMVSWVPYGLPSVVVNTRAVGVFSQQLEDLLDASDTHREVLRMLDQLTKMPFVEALDVINTHELYPHGY